MKAKEKTMAVSMVLIMTCLSCLSGCGKAPAAKEQGVEAPAVEEQGGEEPAAEEQNEAVSAVEEQGEESPVTEEPFDAEEPGGSLSVPSDGRGELISDEDAAALEYMKKYMVEDVFGNGSSYEVYAPDGSDNTDGFLSYIDHGISFFACVYSGGGEELPYMMLNEALKSQKTGWESDGYTDIQLGEVMKNGEDRYVAASATGKDYFGSAYKETVLYYLDIPKPEVGVLWYVEVNEIQVDETTPQLLAQIGQCYGIRLENIMPDGEWAQADEARQVEAQDVYEPKEGEPAMTKVDGYQYLGQVTLSLKDGEIQCPAMAPMGAATMVKEDHLYASMHGVSVYIDSSPTGTDQYVPLLKKSVNNLYEQTINDESVENRNVHKSEVMEMSGYQDAYYYIVDYETPDTKTGEYYQTVSVNCRIIIEEKFALTCDITLRGNEFDTSTNALLQELETAYGIDLSGYYNEE